MSRVTIRVDDPELAEVLEGAENRSATVRDALRLWASRNDILEEEDLTDHQQKTYSWLVERTNGGGSEVKLESTLTVLAQKLGLDKELVKQEALKPRWNRRATSR